MGVRKTLNHSFEEVWDFMFSEVGLKIWLGNMDPKALEVHKEMLLENDVLVEITIFKPFSHLRMKWKKNTWTNTSRLQLRVMGSKHKTVISFAQELLKNKKQREEMLAHWQGVVKNISSALETETGL